MTAPHRSSASPSMTAPHSAVHHAKFSGFSANFSDFPDLSCPPPGGPPKLNLHISDLEFISATGADGKSSRRLMCQVSLHCDGRQATEQFLVDTGAEGAYLHFDLAKKLYGEEFPSPSMETSACIVANSVEVETYRCPKTALTVQGRTLQLRPFAMRTLSYQGILGYDTLTAFGFMIDPVGHRLLPCADVAVDTPCLESGVALSIQETNSLGTLAIDAACCLPPKSGQLVPAILLGDSRVNEFCLLEQTSDGALPDGVMVMTGLATMENSRVNVFLVNTSGLEILVHRHTRVADALRVDHRPLPHISSVYETSPSSVNATSGSKRQQFLDSFKIEASLPLHEKEALKSFLWKERDVFSVSDFDVGCFQGVKHNIDTGTEKPYRETLRRHSPRTREDIKALVDEMLRNGIIEPSFSPWSSAPVLVQKKSGGKRFAVDYRGLNNKTRKDSYPLPQISDALDCFAGARWFSTLDLTQGFWAIELDDESKPKTAFSTPQGLYQFRRMPFGLCNAPATFQRAMACCLEGLNWEIALCFLDDVIVFAKTFEEHLERLRAVFSRFRKYNLKLKPRKCEFLQSEVAYLGHRISAKGITTDPSKIEAIQNMKAPRTVTQLRSFLGLAQYYRRFVKGFSLIAAPLFESVKHGEKRQCVQWGEEQEDAFLELKRHLQNPGVMAHPNFELPFVVDTDASQVGIGCVLSQVIDGKERVIAYQSHKFSRAEKKWSTTDREFYALVVACKLFKSYLYGRQFTLRTDHQALLGLRKKAKELCGKLARWWSYLCNYDYKLIYRKGEAHGNADGLSRQSQFEDDPSDESDSEDSHGINAIMPIPAEPINILTLQRDDPVTNTLRRIVSGEMPDSALKDLDGAKDDYIRHFLRHKRRYSIKNNILLMDRLVVVPRAGLPSLLFILHDCPLSGHLGRNKVRRIVQKRFWWPGSITDVDEYVRSCIRCQARKTQPNKIHQPLHPSEPMDYPFQRIAMDVVKLPKSNGYEMLLVIVDYFTKWVEAFPIRNKSGETIANILLNEVFLRHTTPEYLHSDRGKEFTASVVHELSKLASVYQTHTPAYTPRADGQVERQIRTLTDMLSTYHIEKGSWFPYLNPCLCALRCSPHETTGFSPFEVLYGRQPRLMVDLNYGLPAVAEQKHPSSYKELQDRFQSIHREVKRRQTLAADRMKASYDAKRKVGVGIFAPGQWVWVEVPKGPRPKFLPKFDGPFLVQRANEIGTLYLRRNGGIVKTPQNRCKLFTERPAHLSSQEYKDSFSKASVDFSVEPPALVLDNRYVPPSVPQFFSDQNRVYIPVNSVPLPREAGRSDPSIPASVPPRVERVADPNSASVPLEGGDVRGGSSDPASSQEKPSDSAPSHLRPAGADEVILDRDSVPHSNIPPTSLGPNQPCVVGEGSRSESGVAPPQVVTEPSHVNSQPESEGVPPQVESEPPEVVSQPRIEQADLQSERSGAQDRRVSSRERRPPDRLSYERNFQQISSMRFRRSCWQLRSRYPLLDLGILVGNSPEGPVVLRVEPGSVADRQSLCQPGDRVTHVNGHPIASSFDYVHGLFFVDSEYHTCRVTFAHA